MQQKFEECKVNLLYIPRSRNISADALAKELGLNTFYFFYVNQTRSVKVVPQNNCSFDQNLVQLYGQLTKRTFFVQLENDEDDDDDEEGMYLVFHSSRQSHSQIDFCKAHAKANYYCFICFQKINHLSIGNVISYL